MRMRYSGLVWLLAAGLALIPARVHAQNDYVPPPDPDYPVPLGHPRMEDGGFYFATEFLLWRVDRKLQAEPIAFRGILDTGGSISGTPGTFLGSHTVALSANDVGPGTYQPGFRLSAGWLFKDGWSFEVNWEQFLEAKYGAVAGILPAFGRVGPQLFDSFLVSPVYNFPATFAGPAQKVDLGIPGDTFGIWSAASDMTLQFIQRFTQVEGRLRVPMAGMGVPDDCMRFYGVVGPRADWLWEKFWWRTVAYDVNTGQAGQDDAVNYTNIVSQRFYGGHAGAGWDWYLGNTPIGSIALNVELEVALLADIVKERASYERGDRATASKRSITTYTVAPEVNGCVNLWWYPTEAIQVRVGYNVMAFFNTIAAEQPVSFNFGGLDPPWQKGVVRFIDGLNVGIGFTF